jgi:hypothetical protein
MLNFVQQMWFEAGLEDVGKRERIERLQDIAEKYDRRVEYFSGMTDAELVEYDVAHTGNRELLWQLPERTTYTDAEIRFMVQTRAHMPFAGKPEALAKILLAALEMAHQDWALSDTDQDFLARFTLADLLNPETYWVENDEFGTTQTTHEVQEE